MCYKQSHKNRCINFKAKTKETREKFFVPVTNWLRLQICLYWVTQMNTIHSSNPSCLIFFCLFQSRKCTNYCIIQNTCQNTSSLMTRLRFGGSHIPFVDKCREKSVLIEKRTVDRIYVDFIRAFKREFCCHLHSRLCFTFCTNVCERAHNYCVLRLLSILSYQE